MPYATFEQDRPYLTEKFRHPVFDRATGVENSVLKEQIRAMAEELKDLRVSSVAEAMGEEDAPKTCSEIAEAFAKWLPQFAVREKEKEG